ncbi:MAG: V-type ATP synthase subunit I [Ruminococcaceae bacterium]|nr:V-type ATP synthase subunit I [Oscillospiraceae bacterium]
MLKIELIGALKNSKDIIDFLQRVGVVEISSHEEYENMSSLDTAINISQLEKMQAKALQAREKLGYFAPQKSSLIDSFRPPREITLKEYAENESKTDAAFNTCSMILELDKRITDAKAEIIRLETTNISISLWKELDVPIKSKPTRHTVLLVGTFPSLQTESSVKETLATVAEDIEAYDVEIVHSSEMLSCAAVLCMKSDEQKMLEALRSFGFVKPSETFDGVASKALESNLQRIEKLKEEIEKAEEKIKAYGDEAKNIDFLIDYLAMKIDKYEALKNISITDNIFYLSGFIPEKAAEKTAKALEEKYSCAVNLVVPDEEQDVPVLLQNNDFASPVEGITEMYSLPGKRDIDPNAIMGFFYYVFFGMMFSDAGYGLLMVIGTLAVLLKAKPEGQKRKTVLMYFYCGISTMFWGIMFGSFFGDVINIVRTNYLGLPEMRLHVWLNPAGDDLMTVMLYCFLFGIIHLFVGVGIKGYMEWREGDKLGAICDTLSIYMAIGGVAPILAGMIIEVPSSITNVAKYIALAGVVLIVLTAGRASKGIVGKLGAGLYALYNTVSGYLSDILSYSRLLALGLVTGIIGSVVNMMGTLPSNMVVKTVLFIIVFIIGHAINFGINIIGAYVHTNRLQYVEFFSRFYEGGGNAFNPLKVKSKTFMFKEETNNG